MKGKWGVAVLLFASVLLVAALAAAGTWVLGNSAATVAAQSPQGGNDWWGWMMGGGMMGGYYGSGQSGNSGYAGPCWGYGGTAGSGSGQPLSIEQAREAVVSYLASLGYGDLEVGEVMEFSRNFYAMVEESDTGIGAVELLIDKDTGFVGPEYGPNMMWNAKYGMHRGGGMMGWGTSGKMTVTPEQAVDIAQRWLDAYRPGAVPESHADAFYGYYTLHTLTNGQITGMLSVHGSTGQVWYHNWHGDFIQMLEESNL